MSSAVCTCAEGGQRTCRAKAISFLLQTLPGVCSWLSRIMFRAAVRLSVSGVRSITRTQPGCQGMNTLIGYDLVPEPKIVEAALKACRRLNDLASAIRILEAVKDKAGPHKEIYPYLIQELKPTLEELGISTPEELGIDKV
ncbi:hypothetical protein F7725_023033 [Dissostichus mawsoni]|uniref:Cytochrome c oxidase subunit 5A, mitochondrial n=1 Tax=Dissostichus mawsoni TaxID=36200 RepID=A0A7J5Z3S5_DISMA|nr:hypothetical protein F7725_023033 [Dissostichus mawsoni]